MKLTQGLGVVALLALVSGCGKGELILTGQRQDVRDAVIGGTPDEAVSLAPGENRSVPVSLGAARANADWTQPAGNAQHAPGNVALATTPQPLWAAPIGAGENRKHRITAEPVIAGGRIFTLDSRAVVTATGTGGATVWQTDLTPSADRADDASGGGLATGGGAVFATTGFGDLVALDAASGKELWRQRFDAAVTGAPAYDGGRVYAVSLDGAAWALDASNGKVLWTLTGTPSAAGINGGSAPAVAASSSPAIAACRALGRARSTSSTRGAAGSSAASRRSSRR